MTQKGVMKLYKMQCKEIEIEGETRTLYGVSDENGFFCEFTENIAAAQKAVEFLNDNLVESCHICDVIEDLFYSGCGN